MAEVPTFEISVEKLQTHTDWKGARVRRALEEITFPDLTAQWRIRMNFTVSSKYHTCGEQDEVLIWFKKRGDALREWAALKYAPLYEQLLIWDRVGVVWSPKDRRFLGTQELLRKAQKDDYD